RVCGSVWGPGGTHELAAPARPVWLGPAAPRPPPEAAARDVVVGQHGGPEDSADALRFAFETAAARGAAVRAVRAWTLPPVFAYSPGSLKLLDDEGGLEPFERRSLAEAVRPWRERFPEVPVAEHVEMGSAAQVLLAAAARAQLMVVGRRAHRTAVGARIGSVAYGVLHHAGCPVAVVPHR
ncbi:universal stress protein, partial [Streptomyces collinus]|uniref:universal stress protein n=1 Tax=Streptomyces collinus TaxID=42684 RepID=UPI003678285E